MVDTGHFAEALIAPPFSFCMIGALDTAATEPGGTVIDPSSVENSTELACLTILADTVRLQSLVFRNDAAMYPHSSDVSGGIQHAARLLELRDCIFDSTYRSIQGGEEMSTRLFNCRFLHSSGACVLTQNGAVSAFDCLFQCDSSDWGLVWSSGKTHIERCHFGGTHWFGQDLILTGASAIIQDCLFSPPGPWGAPVITLGVRNAVVEGNQFIGTQRSFCVIQLWARCPGEIVIRNNAFVGARLDGFRFGSTCMNLLVNFEQDTCREFSTAVVSNNRVIGWDSPRNTKAILFGGHGMSINHNRFVDLNPATSPTISVGLGRATLRDNYFQNTGLAVRTDPQLESEIDAAFNWWGDSTGPYHPVSNPDGLGDEVSDRVSFEPWHTDTLFFHESADERHLPLPQKAQLEVFPNPFNATAHLRLFLQQPKIVRIELYDLLGRRARELFVGPVAYVKEIRVDASGLSTGIYFARATDTIERNTLATEKLLLLK